MELLTITNLGISLTELFTMASLIIGLCASWINTRIKISKLETEVKLRLAQMEKEMNDHKQDNEKDLEKLYRENKEDHQSIMQKQDKINDVLNKILQTKIN